MRGLQLLSCSRVLLLVTVYSSSALICAMSDAATTYGAFRAAADANKMGEGRCRQVQPSTKRIEAHYIVSNGLLSASSDREQLHASFIGYLCYDHDN